MITPFAVATSSTKVARQATAFWEWPKTWMSTPAGKACMWLRPAARLNENGIDVRWPVASNLQLCHAASYKGYILPWETPDKETARGLWTGGEGTQLLISHEEDAMGP
ncbi:predicted protein [Histoplasma mississippiense (nom. inval.)]|uniref:predicted protein n=1 Tax=Ajellomyces capsulatus (strain NAm1 / WU24) TaxID=2059318 RepID=UPI000157C64A|nr:predicted protein [Histoplasma mississippiense (nom. inval.)]EDN08098.1 predicted protein [Histoplasma mississippiense (nom. inval.)]